MYTQSKMMNADYSCVLCSSCKLSKRDKDCKILFVHIHAMCISKSRRLLN